MWESVYQKGEEESGYGLRVPATSHVTGRIVGDGRTIDQRVPTDCQTDKQRQGRVSTPEYADLQHWTPNSIPANVKFCEWHDATHDATVRP